MFGSRIKEIREKKNLTAENFANILETSSKTISNYETEKTAPSFIFLEKLNKKLNVNTNWLLTGKGEMFINSEPKNGGASGSNNSVVGFNNINGDITIKINEYNDKEDIKEIVELLKFVPKTTLHRLKDKLNKIKEVNEDIF